MTAKVAVPVVKYTSSVIVAGTLQRQFSYLRYPLPSYANVADDRESLWGKIDNARR